MSRKAGKHCDSLHIPRTLRKCKRGHCSSEELTLQDDPSEDGSHTTEHSTRVFYALLAAALD